MLCNIGLSTMRIVSPVIGGFHSILIHMRTLGGQLYAYYCFMPCASEHISLNCIYFQVNINFISIMNI